MAVRRRTEDFSAKSSLVEEKYAFEEASSGENRFLTMHARNCLILLTKPSKQIKSASFVKTMIKS